MPKTDADLSAMSNWSRGKTFHATYDQASAAAKANRAAVVSGRATVQAD